MTTPTIDTDKLLHRLCERVVETVNEGYLCLRCMAEITSADFEANRCTQCGANVAVDDESVDEHLHEDDGDY